MTYQSAGFEERFEEWLADEGPSLPAERFWAVGDALMRLLEAPRATPAAPVANSAVDMWLIDFPNIPGPVVAAWYVISEEPPMVTLIALATID